MEAKLYDVLHRIAEALETQNSLLENQERRAIRLDALEAKLKKIQIDESKVIKTNPLKRKEV